MKKSILSVSLFVCSIALFILAKVFSGYLFPPEGPELLINLSATIIWTALAIMFLDRIIEGIRDYETSQQWSKTKTIFLDWTILSLNLYIFKALNVVDDAMKTDGNYRQKLSKLTSLNEDEIFRLYVNLPIKDRAEVAESFTKLRRDLVEIVLIFGNKIKDDRVYGELSDLLIMVRDASEFTSLTPVTHSSYDNGIASHLKNVTLKVGQFYNLLSSIGASKHLIL